MRIARVRLDDRVVHAEVEGSTLHLLEGDIFADPARTGETAPLAAAQLLSPTEPRTIYIVLGGFLPRDGSPLPPGTQPRLAVKRVREASGDGDAIVVPPFVTRPLWAEVELAVVVGRRVHACSRDEARAAIGGFTCVNDVSAAQFIYDLETMQPLERPDYFRCKSIDGFAVLGPSLRTDLTEADVAAGLELTARVNGRRLAGGTTATLRFPVSEVVRHVAEQTTLEPGDVIALGTPEPAAATIGDEVEVEVEGIGSLRNRIVAATAR